MAYGYVNAIFNMVMNAYWIRGTPSISAAEKLAHVSDSKMVGKRVVFSLQMWEMETAADTLKGSLVWVW